MPYPDEEQLTMKYLMDGCINFIGIAAIVIILLIGVGDVIRFIFKVLGIA